MNGHGKDPSYETGADHFALWPLAWLLVFLGRPHYRLLFVILTTTCTLNQTWVRVMLLRKRSKAMIKKTDPMAMMAIRFNHTASRPAPR